MSLAYENRNSVNAPWNNHGENTSASDDVAGVVAAIVEKRGFGFNGKALDACLNQIEMLGYHYDFNTDHIEPNYELIGTIDIETLWDRLATLHECVSDISFKESETPFLNRQMKLLRDLMDSVKAGE